MTESVELNEVCITHNLPMSICRRHAAESIAATEIADPFPECRTSDDSHVCGGIDPSLGCEKSGHDKKSAEEPTVHAGQGPDCICDSIYCGPVDDEDPDDKFDRVWDMTH